MVMPAVDAHGEGHLDQLRVTALAGPACGRQLIGPAEIFVVAVLLDLPEVEHAELSGPEVLADGEDVVSLALVVQAFDVLGHGHDQRGVIQDAPLSRAVHVADLDDVPVHRVPPQRCWAAWRVMPSREPISAQE
jgi:hypothetical protein